MEQLPRFENADADSVFKEVGKNITSPGAAALWKRLRSEMSRKDVGAAITYIDSEFHRIEQLFSRELSRAEHADGRLP